MRFDILVKDRAGNFLWLEAAQNESTAFTRVNELATSSPGEYFIFDQRTHRVVGKSPPAVDLVADTSQV
jgi:hypothetical protein